VTRALVILAVGIALGLVFGWWLRFEYDLARRATGRTIDLSRRWQR
jgi:hypothetical protein